MIKFKMFLSPVYAHHIIIDYILLIIMLILRYILMCKIFYIILLLLMYNLISNECNSIYMICIKLVKKMVT